MSQKIYDIYHRLVLACSILLCLVSFILLPVLAYAYTSTVTHVFDGDTIQVQRGGNLVQVRFYGIDCPELEQDFGHNAKNIVSQLLPIGSKVHLDIRSYDRYERAVAIVTINNNETLQTILLDKGLAWLYGRYCRLNTCSNWKNKESIAKQNKVGLWQDKNALPPWKWRRYNGEK